MYIQDATSTSAANSSLGGLGDSDGEEYSGLLLAVALLGGGVGKRAFSCGSHPFSPASGSWHATGPCPWWEACAVDTE